MLTQRCSFLYFIIKGESRGKEELIKGKTGINVYQNTVHRREAKCEEFGIKCATFLYLKRCARGLSLSIILLCVCWRCMLKNISKRKQIANSMLWNKEKTLFIHIYQNTQGIWAFVKGHNTVKMIHTTSPYSVLS